MSYYKEETLILPPDDDNNNSNGMNQTFHYIPKDQKFQSNFMKNRTKSNNNNDALNSAYAMNQTFHHMPKNSNNNNQSNSNNISKKNVSNVETSIHYNRRKLKMLEIKMKRVKHETKQLKQEPKVFGHSVHDSGRSSYLDANVRQTLDGHTGYITQNDVRAKLANQDYDRNIKEDFISLRPKSNHQMKLPWKTVKLRSAKKKKKETVENREKMFKYVKHPVKKKLPPKVVFGRRVADNRRMSYLPLTAQQKIIKQDSSSENQLPQRVPLPIRYRSSSSTVSSQNTYNKWESTTNNIINVSLLSSNDDDDDTRYNNPDDDYFQSPRPAPNTPPKAPPTPPESIVDTDDENDFFDCDPEMEEKKMEVDGSENKTNDYDDDTLLKQKLIEGKVNKAKKNRWSQLRASTKFFTKKKKDQLVPEMIYENKNKKSKWGNLKKMKEKDNVDDKKSKTAKNAVKSIKNNIFGFQPKKKKTLLEKSMEELPTIPFQLAEFVDQSPCKLAHWCRGEKRRGQTQGKGKWVDRGLFLFKCNTSEDAKDTDDVILKGVIVLTNPKDYSPRCAIPIDSGTDVERKAGSLVFYIKRHYDHPKKIPVKRDHIHESWAEENEYQYFIKNCTKSKSMCAIRLKDTDETTMWINLLEEILHSNEA